MVAESAKERIAVAPVWSQRLNDIELLLKASEDPAYKSG
jgi:hypothetical protein